MEDPFVEQFMRYLENEKNASLHTLENYRIDLQQFCTLHWQDASPPYMWTQVDRYDARGFLVHFQKIGDGARHHRPEAIGATLVL